MNKPAFILLLCCAFMAGDAQDFGAYPPAVRWRQINTDTARIIYTAGSDVQAQRIATIIHRQAAGSQLGSGQKKINVVLHNRTTLANGYVALAPFVSEYYLVPGGNIFEFGNLAWADQLAVHEYRHVQQYNNFNKGLSKGFGILFGQGGRALANALSVPDWFFEGDAVYAETALTPQGRGRMPYFLNGYNALWKEGRQYNWMKLRNGSFKDYVPNHYQLGYLLVNYGYEKYGPDFWRKVTSDAASFKGLVYPFQGAVKRHAGVDFKTFRKDALGYYSHEVSRRRDNQKSRETVTNYYHPQRIGQDSLLYVKSSYKKLPHFYLQTAGREVKLALRNITTEDWFSYRNGTVAYTAYKTNPRWSLTDYSNIVLLDVATGTETEITKKSKYFTPDISPSGALVIAVSVNDSLQSELHLLRKNGELVKKIPAQGGAVYVQPRFIDEGSVLVAVRAPDATMALHRINLETGRSEPLTPPTKATVGFPFINNGIVYFTSSLAGADDLYSLDLSNKTVRQITAGGTGNYFPSVWNDTLTWSAFTSNGFRLQEENLKKETPILITEAMWQTPGLPFKVAGEKSTLNLLSTDNRSFTTEKYKKSTGLFNPHSWRPAYEDPEASFSVYSDNILHTFSSEIFYRYNQNETSNAVGFNAIYGGLFPLISGGVEQTFNRHIRREPVTYTLNQTEARIGFSVPLSFTGGNTAKFFNGGANFVFNRISPTGASKALIKSASSTYLHHYIGWSQQLPRAVQHIYPKLGYTLNTQYRHRTDEKGYQALGSVQTFLPTPFKTHSLVLGASFQQTDTNNVIFSNRFANARGYEDYYYSRMWKASANYNLPLLYPDRGLGNIVYLMRLRTNLFYDYTRVFSKNKLQSNNLRSTGSELFFDTKWWNQLPLSIGVRYSYLLDNGLVGRRSPHVLELIIPVLIPD